MVFVDVHVLVRGVEQLPHGAGALLPGQGRAHGIADGHVRVVLIIVGHVPAHPVQALVQGGPVQPVGHGQELVAPGPAHKVLLGHGQAQLLGKGADIGVPRLVTHAVVDPPQVV